MIPFNNFNYNIFLVAPFYIMDYNKNRQSIQISVIGKGNNVPKTLPQPFWSNFFLLLLKSTEHNDLKKFCLKISQNNKLRPKKKMYIAMKVKSYRL